MLNSPTLSSIFVQQPLEITRKQFAQAIIYYYMDDILMADSDTDTLEKEFCLVGDCKLLLKKIQRGYSINYLGYKIGLQKIQPQKVPIRRNQLQTLNDFQKITGKY